MYVQPQLCDAVRRRMVVEIVYSDGHSRVVEPHVVFRTISGEQVLADGYQIAGYSDSGNPRGWKTFDLADVQSVNATGESFDRARSMYNPNGERYSDYICKL